MMSLISIVEIFLHNFAKPISHHMLENVQKEHQIPKLLVPYTFLNPVTRIFYTTFLGVQCKEIKKWVNYLPCFISPEEAQSGAA